MTSNEIKKSIVIAVPKGRILDELLPLLEKWQIRLNDDFFQKDTRKLIFSTNQKYINIVKCRSFDVATFVSYGVADIGICGLDVIKEFSYGNIYDVCNLNIGKCRLSIAGKGDVQKIENLSNIRVATKYPNLTRQYFYKRGIQAEIIKLNGAIEIAANLNLSNYIVDLVGTGKTLKANSLTELEQIFEVSSKIIINKSSLIAHNKLINQFLMNVGIN